MKSRMMTGMLVIAVMAALIGGATMAWFTDTAKSGQITFQAGTLLIGIDDNRLTAGDIDLNKLNPGETWCVDIVVVNEGTKNLKFRGVMCYVDTLGRDLHDFGDRVGYGTDELSKAIEMTLKVAAVQPDHKYLESDLGTIIWSGTLSEYNDWDFGQHAPEHANLQPLAPGETIEYTACFVLPEGTGNEYQGSVISLKFGFLAAQWLPGDDIYPEFTHCDWADEIVPPIPSGKVWNQTKDPDKANLYDTIQAAIDDADDGDTIIVGAGTYEEGTINVNKNDLTLRGAQANVDPRPSTGGRSGPESIIENNWTAMNISGDNVVVNGFTFKSNINNISPNVVEAIDAGFPKIIYNIVYNTNFAGASNEGIKVRRSGNTGALVSYNYVYDIPFPGDAINFDTVNGGVISYNEVRNIGSTNAAIFIYDSLDTEIIGNIVDTTTHNDGIKLGRTNGGNAANSGGLIKDNIVRNTVQDGITVYMSDTVVEGNEVTGSTSENGAIYLAFAISDVEIINNTVHSNVLNDGPKGIAAGILLKSDVNAHTVTINNNSIYNNTPYGVVNNSTLEVDATYNWWGNASGPSGEGLGTGDKVSANVLFNPWLDSSPF